MKCKRYKWLYRLVPVSVWQAFLMQRHLSSCPACREEFSTDTEAHLHLESVGITADRVELPHDLWTRVENEIIARQSQQSQQKVKNLSGKRPVTGKRLALAGTAALFLLLVLSFTLLKKSANPPPPPDEPAKLDMVVNNRQIVIHSIRVENRPARTVYFQPGSNDRLIVWVK
jgi:hypothetical protein